jgi:hypothetical protein
VWLVGLMGIAACSAPTGPTPDAVAACPEGHRADGPACVPIFDDCPGAAERPVLGGGCAPVGVTTCATGFTSDGEGGCDPVLPEAPCAPGTRAQLGETACVPVGVTGCATGFVPDGEGGCDAVLPAGPCGEGLIEQLGQVECQPLGDCGEAPYGDVEDAGDTIYVDGSADATLADGSVAHPFVTVSAALAAAAPGEQVVLAAGDYAERLELDAPVRLRGRCAALVSLHGVSLLGGPLPALRVRSGASGSTIRGLTFTGNADGLLLDRATGVVVEEVQTRDTGEFGIYSSTGSVFTVRRSRVSRATGVGIGVGGGEVRLEQVVVRDTRPVDDGGLGRGIEVDDLDGGLEARLVMQSSVVIANREIGVFLSGADAEIEGSAVLDTRSRERDGLAGRGIDSTCHPTLGSCGSLTVSRSLVAGNREAGIQALGTWLTVVDTTVRDQAVRQSDGLGGAGIVGGCFRPAGDCGGVDVERSSVLRNRRVGIMLSGVEARVTGTQVRDTWPELGIYGWGIGTECDVGGACGGLAVSESLLEGLVEVGVLASGVDAAITRTTIREVLPSEDTSMACDAVQSQCDLEQAACPALRVSASLVERAGGIVSFGVSAEVAGVLLREVGRHATAESSSRGIYAQCDLDLGTCGRLDVRGSVIDGAVAEGIAIYGGDAEIHDTVVMRVTPDPLTGAFGRGLEANCLPELGRCGRVVVATSQVSGVYDVGIAVAGPEIDVASVLVRDVASSLVTGDAGRGISVICQPDLGVCGPVRLTGSLIADTQDVGLFLAGVVATIADTAVRDTAPQASDGRFGRAVNLQCHEAVGSCGQVEASRLILTGSSNTGLFASGLPVTLDSVVIRRVRADVTGEWAGMDGIGMVYLCPDPGFPCGSFSVRQSWIQDTQTTGLMAQVGSGAIERSVIEGVAPSPLDGRFGNGIEAIGDPASPSTVQVRQCVVRGFDLVGLLYSDAAGTISGSVVTGGAFSVVWLSPEVAPTVTDDNVLTGTVSDAPSLQVQMTVASAPPPAALPGTDTEQE